MKAKSTESLKIKKVRCNTLIEDTGNARKHNKRNMAAIAASLERFGQVEPLVIQKNSKQVIGGNGRLTVMLKLGWKMCSVVEVDVNKSEAAALAIALNRTSELAEWDLQTLSETLENLDDDLQSIVGFSDEDLENLLGANWQSDDAVQGDLDDHQRSNTDDKEEQEQRIVILTAEQFDILICALDKMRSKKGDKKTTIGQVITKLAKDYIGEKS